MRCLVLIVSFILLLVPSVNGNAGESTPKIVFEEVFGSKDKLFIVGEIKKGTFALLLSETDAITCLAETTDTELYDHPNGPLRITNLKIKDKCQSTKYLGALIGVSNAKYQFLKAQSFADRKLAQRIALEAPKFEHPECPDYLRLSRTLPNLWLVPDQKEKLVIAQMERKSNRNGPIFLHKNDHTYALKGGCVHEIKAFSVSGRIYLKYIHKGCDGGQYVIFVYDLSRSEPTLIYSNGSWST